MHRDHAVFNLATVAVVLPRNAGSVASAFGGSGLVDTADGLGMGML